MNRIRTGTSRCARRARTHGKRNNDRNDSQRIGLRLLCARHREDAAQERGDSKTSLSAWRIASSLSPPSPGPTSPTTHCAKRSRMRATTSRHCSHRAVHRNHSTVTEGDSMTAAHNRNVGVAATALWPVPQRWSAASCPRCLFPWGQVPRSQDSSPLSRSSSGSASTKRWYSASQALFLVISGALLWNSRRLPCPVEPNAARTCARLRSISYWLYGTAVAASLDRSALCVRTADDRAPEGVMQTQRAGPGPNTYSRLMPESAARLHGPTRPATRRLAASSRLALVENARLCRAWPINPRPP